MALVTLYEPACVQEQGFIRAQERCCTPDLAAKQKNNTNISTYINICVHVYFYIYICRMHMYMVHIYIYMYESSTGPFWIRGHC